MRFAAAAFALSVFLSPAIAGNFEMAGMKSKTPEGWKDEEPSSNMRIGQFKVPRVEGDNEDAQIAVFFFKSGSGAVEQNLKRQLAKFKPAEGKEVPDNTVEKIKIGKIEGTCQDVKGTFLSKFPPFAPNAKITEKPDYRQLYVIFTCDEGEFYLTLLGPAKTVGKNEKEFKEWLANFK